jgi:hypothetical protein
MIRVSRIKQKYIWLVSIVVNMEVHMIQYGSFQSFWTIWASMLWRDIYLVVTDVHHFFQIQTSFDEILNLTAYACEEVRIQLGAMNKFGLAPSSFFSHTSLSVEVYGGIIIIIVYGSQFSPEMCFM